MASQGKSLVELIALTKPNTTAEGEIVVVTVPVSFSGFAAPDGQIRLLLTIEQAQEIAGQIVPVIQTARVNLQRKK